MMPGVTPGQLSANLEKGHASVDRSRGGCLTVLSNTERQLPGIAGLQLTER